ncbi:MAG: type II toxin-antitoxin system Phd/YefM family antitoxin [Clostridia bacterium]|nr:type II toxin-antitoxin system Phd/YefM family antitoxin [Clostridia bacterium]
MNINTETIVPISDANRNFSKVARLVDQYGSAVIMKNNAPRYIIYEFSQAEAMQAAADDEVIASSLKLMQRNAHVYEELAK